jgi:hypothetical protein
MMHWSHTLWIGRAVSSALPLSRHGSELGSADWRQVMMLRHKRTPEHCIR